MQGCITVNVPKLAITSDQPVNAQGAKATFIIFYLASNKITKTK